MDLPQSVDFNKTALARIVGGLFVLLGLKAGVTLGRIPRQLHSTVLRILQPAESAARRLIVIVAMCIDMKAIKVKASRLRPASPVPAGPVSARPVSARPVPARSVPARSDHPEKVRAKSGEPRLFFKLFDPRQRFFRKPPQPGNQPRPRPSITFYRDGEYRRVSLFREPPPKKADGLETSAHLVSRLEALMAALNDLPHQAMRLARAQARRQSVPRLKLQSPLRPGPAPGSRQKPVQDIDHVLERCHWLAREALASAIPRLPDTS